MNILIFDEAAWNNNNSFGNTISNFFVGEEWKEDSFSCFYSRKALPNRDMNVDYYNLSYDDIFKGFLHFHIKGRRFFKYPSNEELTFYQSSEKKERQIIDKVHNSKGSLLLMFFNRLFWRSGIWLGKDFRTFIKDNSPDVMFAFMTTPSILIPLGKYLQKTTDCKIVLLAADELYLNYEKLPFIYRKFQRSNFKQAVKMADKLYAITDELSELYSSLFSREFSILRKSCEELLPINENKTVNNPIRIVYAGNLQYGRDKTLIKLAESISNLNLSEQKLFLEIYTGTTIDDEIKALLNIRGSSAIMGSRSNVEIKDILRNADVVLHVESFEEKYIDEVKYSFSTKITDCLQSGSVIMAIGDKAISSIKYIKKINGAIVVEDIDTLNDALERLISNTSSFMQRISEANTFAKKNHAITSLQRNLRKDLQILVNN